MAQYTRLVAIHWQVILAATRLIVPVVHRGAGVEADVERLIPRPDERLGPRQRPLRHLQAVDRERGSAPFWHVGGSDKDHGCLLGGSKWPLRAQSVRGQPRAVRPGAPQRPGASMRNARGYAMISWGGSAKQSPRTPTRACRHRTGASLSVERSGDNFWAAHQYVHRAGFGSRARSAPARKERACRGSGDQSDCCVARVTG